MISVVFLDRDGVINKDPEMYVTRWEDFVFIPRVLSALKKLSENQFKIFIISNQAGIGRKLYTNAELDIITRNMLNEISSSGASIDGIFYCPHIEQDNCNCRKPKTGSLQKVKEQLTANFEEIDLKNSYFLGDKLSDIQAGCEFGVKTILVLSGKSKRADIISWPVKPDFVADDLWDAVVNIICCEKNKIY
ncbi:MAG: HAD family hydrolase [Candidatus Omnitrophota bacterium]